jgi:hypothetical protein
MAAMATLALTAATESGRSSSRTFTFLSICTAYRQRRAQNFCTRRGVLRLIEKARVIEAYCGTCDVVSPVNAQERLVTSRASAADQLSTVRDAAFESTSQRQA